jgi:hypothetical protein
MNHDEGTSMKDGKQSMSNDEAQSSPSPSPVLYYDRTELEQLFPKGSDGKSTARTQPALGEVDYSAALASNFAEGKGVVTISSSMTDEQVAALIKVACNWSKGKSFQVIPPQA